MAPSVDGYPFTFAQNIGTGRSGENTAGFKMRFSTICIFLVNNEVHCENHHNTFEGLCISYIATYIYSFRHV